MSRLIWIDAVYKSILLSPVAVKELIFSMLACNPFTTRHLEIFFIIIIIIIIIIIAERRQLNWTVGI